MREYELFADDESLLVSDSFYAVMKAYKDTKCTKYKRIFELYPFIDKPSIKGLILLVDSRGGEWGGILNEVHNAK